VDDPDWPITELLDTPQAQWKEFLATHPLPHQRIYLGRNDDKSAVLRLKDPDGHDRIIIQVAADGSPVIQFLDAAGKVTSQLPAPSSK
jgi:hypothetical protein